MSTTGTKKREANLGRTLAVYRKLGATRIRFEEGKVAEVWFAPPADVDSPAPGETGSQPPQRREVLAFPDESPRKRTDLDALDLPGYPE